MKVANKTPKRTKFNSIWTIITSVIILVLLQFVLSHFPFISKSYAETKFFQFAAIDTMKYSRDASGENLSTTFIDSQIEKIAKTGATHVAIGTPYDEQFVPVIKKWVTEIRKYHMHVWFRGNFSGWEGWFSYSKNVTRSMHLQLLKNFLTLHPDLFESGDIFVSCPECENGGPGDPRVTKDVPQYREFLIGEKQAADAIFKSQGKSIATGYYSMNGDVARLIMDKATTNALGGTVTIDHYVATPEKLYYDIHEIARESGGKIVLGEFGAPIPDINGNFTEEQQASWVDQALEKIVNSPEVLGVNYWVSFGGSTKLWNDNGTPRKVVDVVTKFYTPTLFEGVVYDQFGNGVKSHIDVYGKTYETSKSGKFVLPIAQTMNVLARADGYSSNYVTLYSNQNHGIIKLNKLKPSFWDSFKSKISCLFLFCKN